MQRHEVLTSLADAVLCAVCLCRYSWKLSLCCFATIPPIIHVSRAYAKWSTQLYMQQYVGWGAANNICTEAFSNIRTVHSFSTEEHERSKVLCNITGPAEPTTTMI